MGVSPLQEDTRGSHKGVVDENEGRTEEAEVQAWNQVKSLGNLTAYA